MTDARRFRRFIAGDLEAAEARFDAARALNPELRPYLWQRGITKVRVLIRPPALNAYGSAPTAMAAQRTETDAATAASQVLPGQVRRGGGAGTRGVSRTRRPSPPAPRRERIGGLRG